MKPSSTALAAVHQGDHPLPPDGGDYWYGLVNEKVAADFRGVSERKMQKDRQTGRGPKFIRSGGAH